MAKARKKSTKSVKRPTAKKSAPKKASSRTARSSAVKARKVAKSKGASTAGASPKRNSKSGTRAVAKKIPAATSQDPIQFPEEHRKTPKTKLSAKELREFKTLLLGKRTELCGDVEHLTDEALNNKSAGASEQSSMPIHMADLGSDNWEREFTLGLIASERALVREIDDALERIQKKTYGVCLATHKSISEARLRAKPWAKYCIEYARAREEGRAL